METSQIVLNHGLTFLAIATGIILVVVGGFLIKLLFDLSKLTKNIDETTTIVKSEIKPTLEEFNNAMKSISSIAQNADRQVGSLGKLIESTIGAGSLLFTKAKDLSGGVVKTLTKGIVTLIKLFLKK
jgi:hypothetical protein